MSDQTELVARHLENLETQQESDATLLAQNEADNKESRNGPIRKRMAMRAKQIEMYRDWDVL